MERLQPAALDSVLDTLLADPAPARMVAIAENGTFTPLPPGVPVTTQVVVSGGTTAMDMVVTDDRVTIIDTWTRARTNGHAMAAVHPVDDPEHEAHIHFVDATHRFGVYLGLLVGTRTSSGGQGATLEALRPKVTVVRKDELAMILGYDDAFTAILGWAEGELVGRRSLELVHPEDHARAIANYVDLVTRPGQARRVRLRHQHRDGSWRWFEVTNTNLLHLPEHGYVSAEMVDISDEMDAVEALRAGELLLRRLTEALPVGVLQIGADRAAVYLNSRLTDILERTVTGADSLLGAAREAEPLARALGQALVQGQDADLEVEVDPGPAGADHDHPLPGRRVQISIRALVQEDGSTHGAILCISDVTDAAQLREQLAHKAAHDALTGCLTRGAVVEQLAAALEDVEAGVGVLFIDLDRFKAVNDDLGHAAGDALLQHVAQVLRAESREIDHVGRLGGDEFLVVMPRLASQETAATIAERLALAISRPVELAGRPHVPGATIGMAWTTTPTDAETLIAEADASMYRAKPSRTA